MTILTVSGTDKHACLASLHKDAAAQERGCCTRTHIRNLTLHCIHLCCHHQGILGQAEEG